MTSAELMQELRSTRPTAGDDLRERVRALAAVEPARRRPRFERLSPRRLALVALPATAVVTLGTAAVLGLARSDRPAQLAAEQSLGSVTRGEASGGVTPTSPQADATYAAPATKGAAAGAARLPETAPAPAPGRAQQYSAQLTIEVKDTKALSEATQRALATARELGGYVVTVSYASSESGSATMTLRVPTASVQEAIVRLSQLGRIVSQQVQIDDLQGQVDELAKHESTLRQRIARLSAQLAAPDLDEATSATLRARRDAARAELAQVRATRTQVDGQARYATIQLALATPQDRSAAPAAPSRFDRGLDEAGTILAWEATIALYALVLTGPFALAALAVWVTRRALRRREHERLLAAP